MTPFTTRRVRPEDAHDLERAGQAGRLLAEALGRLPPGPPAALQYAVARKADDFLWGPALALGHPSRGPRGRPAPGALT
jgi:hypothetical protein